MIKRLFDIIFAILGLFFLFPLFVFLGLLVKLTSRGPIFFKQERVGQKGVSFDIYKFRTMCVGAQKEGLQITVGGRDSRITTLGYWLRRFKLDELPQLINVLRGEMSFVGPRPEVPYYVAFYNSKQKGVLEVKPGITDLASIEYRHENELLNGHEDPERKYIEEIMPAKLEINMAYLERRTFFRDLGVIIKTVCKVLG